MTTENIVIKVSDSGVDATARKIEGIGTAALKSQSAVDRLNKALNSNPTSKINQQLNQSIQLQNQLAAATTRATNSITANTRAAQALTSAHNSAVRAIGNASQANNSYTQSLVNSNRARIAARQTTIDLGSSISNLQTAVVGLAGAMGLRELATMADTWTRTTGKVNIFSHSIEETNAVMQELYEIAQRTRQPLDGVGSSFHQLSIASASLGATQQQTLDFTEAIGKALAIQGTDANTARGGIIQLGQAMNEGIVRAQEYNSMINAMPIVLKTVANNLDGVGGSLAKLRQLMLDGKLYSRDFFEALLRGTDDLDKMFERSGKTIGQSMTIMYNALTRYVGLLDQSTGFSAKFYESAQWVAKNIDHVVNGLIAIASPAIISGLSKVVVGLRAIGVAILANPITAVVAAITAAVAALVLYRDEIILVEKDQISLGDYMRATWDIATEAATKAVDYLSSAWSTISTEFLNEFGIIGQVFADLPTTVGAVVNSAIATFVVLGKTVGIVFAGIGPAIKDGIITAINQAIEWTETGINKLIGLINMVREQVNLESYSNVTIDRLKNDQAGQAAELGAAIREAYSQAIQQDYLQGLSDTAGAALDKLTARAREIAKQRHASQAGGGGFDLNTPNGTGENYAGAGGASGSGGLKGLDAFIAKTEAVTKTLEQQTDAYLKGEVASKKYTDQQKIENQVIKFGEGARAAITKAINDHTAAQDRNDVAKRVADLRKETEDLRKQAQIQIAHNTSLAAGEEAQRRYNIEKEKAAILNGRSAESLGLINDQLDRELERNERQRINLDKQRQLKDLISETATEQEKFNAKLAELEALRPYAKTPEAIEAVERAMANAKKEASVFGQVTEQMIERIDGAFANAWSNIFDGADNLWDGLKQGFKQALGEIMHMLTTKPILQSISDWITGTDSGKGIGDVLGNIFGGDNKSNRGNAFGSIIDIGKKIYSVYDTLTGVGSEVVSGFMKDGLTGALKGGINYYGTMLEGVYSKVAAMFGKEVVTQAAANAASSAAAQAAGQAAGNSLAVNAGQYAAGSVAQGALSSTLTSVLKSISGTFTNPATWITAGVMASWKLYNSGVKASPSGVRNSFEGANDYAQVIGKTREIETYGFQLIDKFREIENWMLHPLPSALIGGERLAAISTGSPVFQAVTQVLGRLLGGGKERFKTTVASATGTFSNNEYRNTGKVAGWYEGSKQFGSDVEETLHDINKAFSTTLGEIFKKFDIDEEIKTESSFRLRRTSGKLATVFAVTIDDAVMMMKGQYSKDGNVAKGLEKFFDDVMGRGMAQAIQQSDLPAYLKELTNGIKDADALGEALNGLFGRFDSVNTIFETMGIAAFKLDDGGLRAADSLLNLVASVAELENATTADKINAFSELTAAYNGMFGDDTQKLGNAIKAMRSQFEALDLVMPATKEGFADIVKGLDMTKTENQQLFISLMNLSQGLSEIYQVTAQLEDQFKNAFTPVAELNRQALNELVQEFDELGVKMPNTKSAFYELVQGIDQTTVAGQDLRRSLLELAPGMADYLNNINAVRDSYATSLGTLRERIYMDSLGTDENKYNYIKSQADALIQMIPVLTSADSIGNVMNQYANLASQAYGYLDESGRGLKAEEFIETLNAAEAVANERLMELNKAQSEQELKAQEEMLSRMAVLFSESMKGMLIETATAMGVPMSQLSMAAAQFEQATTKLVYGTTEVAYAR